MYAMRSVGNEHRLLAIHRLSQKKTLTPAAAAPPSSFSVAYSCWKPNKSHYVRTHRTGTDRSCSSHFTWHSYLTVIPLLTCQHPTSVKRDRKCAPWSYLGVLYCRSKLCAYIYVRKNSAAFPAPIFTTLAQCAMSYTECHRTRTTRIDIHVQYVTV